MFSGLRATVLIGIFLIMPIPLLDTYRETSSTEIQLNKVYVRAQFGFVFISTLLSTFLRKIEQ